ncbi:MAG: LEA type 2 family protein, partial [Deltaproteobacteria bacterium]|nr:LEA type 2 family protein [Deltaproteobacteria bacterium]
MKRPGKIIAIGLLFLLPSCLSLFLEKPTFTLKEIEIKRISFQEIDFLFGIEVQNPNQFDLKLRALEYTVYLSDQEVGKGRLEKEITIVKSASTLVP